MPFTDEKQRGYAEQLLPLLAENWNTPASGLRVTEGGGLVSIKHLWEAVHWSGEGEQKDAQAFHRWALALRDESWCGWRGRGQINTSNTAQSRLQRSTGADQYRQTLFKNKGRILNMVRISKHMALLTELFTQVNKTFGTKYMYRNAKWNKTAIFFLFISLTLYSLLFFRVTVSKHKLVYCAKTK